MHSSTPHQTSSFARDGNNQYNAIHSHAAADTNEEGLASTLEAIAKLPPSNKDTLAYLILHLQRVAYYSTANKMPLANLVTVFAPTVVGNGSAKPSDADLLRDAKHQPKVNVCQA